MEASHTPLPPVFLKHWYNSPEFCAADPWRAFDPARSALIIIDMMAWQVGSDGGAARIMRLSGMGHEADYLARRCEKHVVPNLKRVLPVCRAAGMTIVHARLASQEPDYTDIVPALRSYVSYAEARDGSAACEPVDGLFGPSDLSVVKPGSGAFSSPSLDLRLRERGISALLLAGVVTDACVLLSAAAGFDFGYRQFVLADCTAATSDSSQQEAIKLIGSYLAQPVSSEQLLARLEATFLR